MSKLTNEPIVLEAYGARIYTHFCASCGCERMDETEALDKVVCSDCGCDSVKVLRDAKMERLLMERETTLH